MTEEQAKKIDLILTILISENSGTEFPIFHPDGISLKSGISKDEILDLIDTIEILSFQDNPIVFVGSQRIPTVGTFKYLKGTYNTKLFLTEGGCVHYFEQEKQRLKKEKDLKQLEEEKLKNDVESFRISKKQYQWNKWLAIVAIIVSVSSILLQVFKVIE